MNTKSCSIYELLENQLIFFKGNEFFMSGLMDR